MARGKDFILSIILRTRDRFSRGLRRLKRGLALVKRAARAVAIGVVAIGAAVGGAVFALKKMVDVGDNLAKTADRIGISVDALAQLRFAAEQSGVSAEDLDKSIEGLGKRMGEAKAGTGSLFTLLKKVSPELLEQVQNTKDAGEGFELMAAAIMKIEDPTKRAALASAAFGRSGIRLTNLLSKGPKGVRELRKEFFELAGPQENFARASEEINDALNRTKKVLVGVAGSIITALAPAFLKISARATDFFQRNRAAIQEWVADFGEKLPARINSLIGFFKKMGSAVATIARWGKEILIVFGAFKLGGLIASFGAAGGAMGTFAGKLSGAVAGLGLFAAALAVGVRLLEEGQEKEIADRVRQQSLREQLVGKFAGGRAAFKAAEEAGVVKPGGEFDRLKIGEALLPERAREDFRRTAAVLGPEKALGIIEDRVGSKIDEAIQNLEAGRVKERVFQERKQAAAVGTLGARAAAGTVGQPVDGRLKIDITGAPPGTRTTLEPGAKGQIDVSTGFLLGATQ